MKKFLTVLICAITLLGCEEKSKKKEELRSVKYTVASSQNSNVKRSFSGVVEAEIDSMLSFRVPGTIEKKFFKYGDTVEKGDLLAKLDPKDYKVKYQSSVAELERSKAILTRNKADFERIQKLYFNDNVSKAEYDSSLALFESSRADVKASLENVKYDKIQLGYTSLIAPESGVIAKELSDENETVTQGKPVYRVSMDGDLEVEFYVPESLITKFHKDGEVDVTIDASEKIQLKGEIIQIGSVSTGFGRTFPVKVRLINPESDIKSGMTAQIKFDFNSAADKKAFLLPLDSVLEDSNNMKYVFVVENVAENIGTIKRVDVSTGKVSSEGIEVTSGLDEGELVVSVGVSKVDIGKKVRLYNREGR